MSSVARINIDGYLTVDTDGIAEEIMASFEREVRLTVSERTSDIMKKCISKQLDDILDYKKKEGEKDG